jgi:hypothetical protein
MVGSGSPDMVANLPRNPQTRKLTSGGRCRVAAGVPCNGIVQAIVAPKELTSRYECRRAEDVESPRLLCSNRVGLTNGVGTGQLDDAGRGLPDLREALRNIRLTASLLALDKPTPNSTR